MKILPLIPMLFIASGLNAACSTEETLNQIRPGAQWSITNSDLSTMIWVSTQTRPTQKEVTQAIAACQAGEISVKQSKDQAKLDLNTKSKTDTQRIDAIIKYLGLDQ